MPLCGWECRGPRWSTKCANSESSENKGARPFRGRPSGLSNLPAETPSGPQEFAIGGTDRTIESAFSQGATA